MYKTYLSLLPSDVRDSAAVVNGPTFSCQSMSGLSLLPIHFPWFVDWSSCVHRNVASEDEMTQHCVADTQNWRVSHHITSHHITSHQHTELACITSHHFTSHHTKSEHIKPRHVTSTSHHNSL